MIAYRVYRLWIWLGLGYLVDKRRPLIRVVSSYLARINPSLLCERHRVVLNRALYLFTFALVRSFESFPCQEPILLMRGGSPSFTFIFRDTMQTVD